ncbi:MAG: hypothetical protein HY706_07295 [Candidatus Hydrogenedentes bacterium]|nr:hypothetical protein [Candidatus Hydrogenedentota bacterium]
MTSRVSGLGAKVSGSCGSRQKPSLHVLNSVVCLAVPMALICTLPNAKPTANASARDNEDSAVQRSGNEDVTSIEEANLGFEQWSQGLPISWFFPSDHEKYFTRTTKTVKEGQSALVCSGPQSGTQLFQFVRWPADIAGKTVALSAEVLCSEPNSAALAIRLEDFRIMYSVPHPGDGQWHTSRVCYRAPAYYVFDHFAIALARGNAAEQPGNFDAVTVNVE